MHLFERPSGRCLPAVVLLLMFLLGAVATPEPACGQFKAIKRMGKKIARTFRRNRPTAQPARTNASPNRISSSRTSASNRSPNAANAGRVRPAPQGNRVDPSAAQRQRAAHMAPPAGARPTRNNQPPPAGGQGNRRPLQPQVVGMGPARNAAARRPPANNQPPNRAAANAGRPIINGRQNPAVQNRRLAGRNGPTINPPARQNAVPINHTPPPQPVQVQAQPVNNVAPGMRRGHGVLPPRRSDGPGQAEVATAQALPPWGGVGRGFQQRTNPTNNQYDSVDSALQ